MPTTGAGHVFADFAEAVLRIDAASSVSAGAKVLADDEVCSCLDETGERRVRLYERCERCGAFMAGAGQVPADIIEKARAVVEAYTAWSEDHNDGEFAYYKSEDLMNACVGLRAALAVVRTPEEPYDFEKVRRAAHERYLDEDMYGDESAQEPKDG